MRSRVVLACALTLLLAVRSSGWAAQVAKAEAADGDATLKHELVLKFDECKVPVGKTFTVEVQLQVTPEGQPTEIKLSKTSGYSCLDKVAVAAINAAQFAPARQHGRAVMQEVVMPVDFTRVDMAQNDGMIVSPGTKAASILSKPRIAVGSCKVKSGSSLRAVVGLTVDTQGKPTDLHVVDTTGDSCLDGVALKDAAAYTFDPARRNGQPVSFEMKIEMVFEQ